MDSAAQADGDRQRDLHRALRHLYDPVELGKSPLIVDLGLTREADRASALRRVLREAIEALKPGTGVPPQAMAWRIYSILSQRYIEQFTQREVATNLALSIRHLERLEAKALSALMDQLGVQRRPAAEASPESAEPALDRAAAAPTEGAPTREQELEWLRNSSYHEAVSVAEMVREALETLRPLAQALGVEFRCAVPDVLPLLVVHSPGLRQALLSVLTAAIRSAPSGHVTVSVRPAVQQVLLDVQAQGRLKPGARLSRGHAESLQMARELAALSGGALEVHLGERGQGPFLAQLALPVVPASTVLVIDDNADTLRLIERYLAGTRYRFVGASDPQQALTLAGQVAPQAIILDVMLPGLDGWQLLGRLHEHPRTRAIPVIVCTILPDEDLALALGAAALVRKPVSRLTLLAALDRQLT